MVVVEEIYIELDFSIVNYFRFEFRCVVYGIKR